MDTNAHTEPGPIRRWLSRLCMTIGAITILSYAAVLAGFFFLNQPEEVPDRVLLEIDLGTPFVELDVDGPLAALTNRDALSLRAFLASMNDAANDDRVAGLVARVGSAQHGFGLTQEIRRAIEAFRAKGKFAIAYAESFGELGPANQAYYLATAFDEIWLQPSGSLGLTGLAAEVPFLADTFEKLGIEPRMDHRGVYKTAMNTFTEREFTEAHERSLRELLGDLYEQLVDGISERRAMTPETVKALVDRGPFLAGEARELQLVDRLGYRDEVYAAAKERAGESAELLFFGEYRNRSVEVPDDAPVIALIYAVGTIQRGASEYSPLSGSQSLGGDTLAQALREAAADDDVKAVVLRVDSPGGSYVASDTVWRETERLRESGKPLVVSMGNVAASGGYFVAAAADRILAEAATITGSIGVFAGKVLLREFWERIGVRWGTVSTAENAAAWSSVKDYTPEQWARFQAFLDAVYVDFTTKVASGRELPIEKVREVAQGRVWTGTQALERGLIDEIGGLRDSVRAAARLAGVAEDAEVALRLFPESPGIVEALLGRTHSNSEPAKTALRMLSGAARLLAGLDGVAGRERWLESPIPTVR